MFSGVVSGVAQCIMVTRRPATLARGRVYLGFVSPLRHEHMFDSAPGVSMNLGCFRVKSALTEVSHSVLWQGRVRMR